jgi:hypothetical protein
MSDALDRAIAMLAKAQERQDTLATTRGADMRDVAAACQDRDVFLADVVRLGIEHLRQFGDDD